MEVWTWVCLVIASTQIAVTQTQGDDAGCRLLLAEKSCGNRFEMIDNFDFSGVIEKSLSLKCSDFRSAIDCLFQPKFLGLCESYQTFMYRSTRNAVTALCVNYTSEYDRIGQCLRGDPTTRLALKACSDEFWRETKSEGPTCNTFEDMRSCSRKAVRATDCTCCDDYTIPLVGHLVDHYLLPIMQEKECSLISMGDELDSVDFTKATAQTTADNTTMKTTTMKTTTTETTTASSSIQSRSSLLALTCATVVMLASTHFIVT